MCHCPVGAVLDFPRASWGPPVPDTHQLSRPVATPPNTPGRKKRVLSGGFRPLWGRGSQPCWFCRIPSHPHVCPRHVQGPGLWAKRLQDGNSALPPEVKGGEEGTCPESLSRAEGERREPELRASHSHSAPSVSGSPRGALGHCPWCLRRPSSSLVRSACKWPGLS